MATPAGLRLALLLLRALRPAPWPPAAVQANTQARKASAEARTALAHPQAGGYFRGVVEANRHGMDCTFPEFFRKSNAARQR
jgi:hypothetical protein